MLWDPLGAWPAGRRWLWGMLAVLVCFAQGPTFLDVLRPSRGLGIDFFQEWASARNVIRGLPVYTNLEITAKLYLGYERHSGDKNFIELNAHPPTSVLLGIPFALLDYPEATLAWNLLSLAALVFSLSLVVRELDLRFEPWAIFPMVSLLLLCNPLRQQVFQGQLNLVLLLLLTGVWISDRNERPWLTGMLLGAATAIKIFPGFLFVYFLLRRKWVNIAAGLLWVALFTLLTLAVLGVGTYRSYFFDVIPSLSRFRSWLGNASITAFWLMAFDTGAFHNGRQIQPVIHSIIIARSGTILSCSVLLAIWARVAGRAHSRRDCDRAFGLTITVMLLISPITWDHYFLLLLLPLTLMWIELPQSVLMRSQFLALLVCLWFNAVELWPIFLPDVPGSSNVIVAPAQLLIMLLFQCYAVVGVFVLSLIIKQPERALECGREPGLQGP